MASAAPGLIAFDLDGTLIDSLAGIHASLAVACASLDLSVPTPEQLRHHIGPPLRQYLPELLELPPASAQAVIDQLLPKFRRHHDQHGWRNYCLYDGVLELLTQLSAAGWSLHVVTHKPHQLAEQLLQQEGLAPLFETLHAPGAPGWQSKATALQRLRQSEVMSHWYVGDTASDGEAADQAGYRFVAACYGYGQCASANARISAPLQLLEALRGAEGA